MSNSPTLIDAADLPALSPHPTPTSTLVAPTWTRARSELANSVRRGDPAIEIAAARQNLKFARLAGRVQEAIDAAPPLTPEQRAYIADLLIGAGRPQKASA